MSVLVSPFGEVSEPCFSTVEAGLLHLPCKEPPSPVGFGQIREDGIVLCAEKKAQSKLLAKPKTSEKMYKVRCPPH